MFNIIKFIFIYGLLAGFFYSVSGRTATNMFISLILFFSLQLIVAKLASIARN